MKKTTLRNATLTMKQAFDELIDPSPTKAEIAAAIKNFKSCCAYCGRSLTNTYWDHVIPASGGGSNQIRNRVPSCKDCNEKKGNRYWREFVSQKNKDAELAIDKWIKAPENQPKLCEVDPKDLRRELDKHINSFKEFYERTRKAISNRATR